MTINFLGKSADAFRTISEVAEALKLPQHVLRFWETRFPQIKPMKRAGNRRFYRPEDVELLGAIRKLLYDDGYTIKGVQRILREQGPRAVAQLARSPGSAPQPDDGEAGGDEDGDFAPANPPVEDRHSLPGAPAGEEFDEAPPQDLAGRLRRVLDEIDACRQVLLAARR